MNRCFSVLGRLICLCLLLISSEAISEVHFLEGSVSSGQNDEQPENAVSEKNKIEARRWLEQHPGLTLSTDVAWPPFEYMDADGRFQGMIPDFIALVQKQLNYQFEEVYYGKWEDTLELMKERKIDVLAGLAKTPQREQYMDFTSPIFSFPIVLVIRDDERFIGDLRELKNEKVGVVKGYASYDYLLINHPNLNLVFLDNLEQGLLKLSSGELDVLVSNIPSVSFLVKKLGISNLKVTSVTPYKYDLRLAVNPDHPELLTILEKAISQISQQEKDDLYNRWISKDTKPVLDYDALRRVLLVAAIVVMIFFYWNRKLSKEVAERVRSETALRKSEDQLRKAKLKAEVLAQQTSEASRAKSAFLANMSHEIRTPMNAVMGYTELLSQTLTDSKQKSYLDSIQKGSRALLTLINDILDLSKIEAGKLEMEYTPVCFVELLKEVEQIFAAKIESKGLDFEVVVDPALPKAELLDQTRLRQVLFNLVGNAIKFTDRGKITLRAYKGEKARPEGHFDMVFEVEDTGIGIPKDQQELIFNAFEQQQGQSTERYGGTGLGLTISRKLIEMMGGQLSLESEPGKGSMFRVELRNVGEVKTLKQVVPEFGQAKAGATASEHLRFKPAKVLIVDDRPENRQLLIEYLSGQSLEIKTAENGAMAVITATQWLPDVILMDLRMPVLDGFGAIARLQHHPELRKVPVIAVTAAAMREDAIRIERAGFQDYIKKPVLQENLFQVLLKYLPVMEVEKKDSQQGVSESQKDIPATETTAFLSKVRGEVNRLLNESWPKLREGADMAANRQFVRQLSALTVEGAPPAWRQYIEDLEHAIDQFDLDGIRRLLAKFPDLVDD